MCFSCIMLPLFGILLVTPLILLCCISIYIIFSCTKYSESFFLIVCFATSSNFFSLNRGVSTRKLRTYSYRRAISTPPRINALPTMISLPDQSEHEVSLSSRITLCCGFFLIPSAHDRMVKSIVIVISVASVQNLLAPFCCVLG